MLCGGVNCGGQTLTMWWDPEQSTKRTSDLHGQQMAYNPAVRRATEHLLPTEPWNNQNEFPSNTNC